MDSPSQVVLWDLPQLLAHVVSHQQAFGLLWLAVLAMMDYVAWSVLHVCLRDTVRASLGVLFRNHKFSVGLLAHEMSDGVFATILSLSVSSWLSLWFYIKKKLFGEPLEKLKFFFQFQFKSVC
jgi:hypothetical protein